MYKSLLVLVLLVMVVGGCAMDRNIQTTDEYDGVWQFKIHIHPGYYLTDKVEVVNGRFHKQYPNHSNVLKGYIAANGRFSAVFSFNHGGWNHGAFVFSLDRERSTTKRIVGKWSGLDGAYFTGKDKSQYGGGKWEATKLY
jgi:hypothetical protein